MNKLLLLFIISVGLASCSTVFTEQERSIISASEDKLPLKVYKITHKQDSILLRTKSTRVNFKKDRDLIQKLGKRMHTTMIDSANAGVGIAAPQVGILKQMIVVQRFDKETFPIEVFINPKIIQYSTTKQECVEGCLSIPDYSSKLNVRAKEIILKYQDLEGKKHKETIQDFTAVIFQHEVDHLNGILFIDYENENNTHH